MGFCTFTIQTRYQKRIFLNQCQNNIKSCALHLCSNPSNYLCKTLTPDVLYFMLTHQMDAVGINYVVLYCAILSLINLTQSSLVNGNRNI